MGTALTKFCDVTGQTKKVVSIRVQIVEIGHDADGNENETVVYKLSGDQCPGATKRLEGFIARGMSAPPPRKAKGEEAESEAPEATGDPIRSDQLANAQTREKLGLPTPTLDEVGDVAQNPSG